MSQHRSNFLSIHINCTKIPDHSFYDTFKNQELSLYNEIEQLKKHNSISRIPDQSIPIIINIDNQLPWDIKDIRMKIIADSGPISPIDFSRKEILKSRESWNGLLFDMSGFKQMLVKLDQIHYNIVNGAIHKINVNTNTPILINFDDINSTYHGYRSHDEMEAYILLKFYLDYSFSARGLLIKFAFKMLEQIMTSKSFEFEGEKTLFSDAEIPSIQSMLQIDIIAKIMMYIEDLIILLEAIREHNANYYKLLDKNNEEDIELGQRIRQFFINKEKFNFEDWRTMLSYVKPDQTSHEHVITKLINVNIEGFKEFLNYVEVFRQTHIGTFRRYKHAGFPFKPGYVSQQPYPFTSIMFESYSMIFTGANPLVDIIPLPFSNDVIESYRILLPSLQKKIEDIVQSRIQCIRRRTEGIIPTKSYSAPDAFSEDEKMELISTIKIHNDQFPNRAYDDVYNFPITPGNVQNMKWYIDLDKNMEKWKKIK
jgi:hypothetical protein